MKNLSIILTALSAGTTPMLAEPAPAPTEVVRQVLENRSGQESIRAIRQAYEEGRYAKFLKELNDSYNDLKEEGLSQLAEMRIGNSSDSKEWRTLSEDLQNERNQALLEAVEGKEKTAFVEQVLSAAASLSDDAHQKAILQMVNLRTMAPGTGATADENRLIDIDLEYEFKALHLDLSRASPADAREKLCALRMEKLQKMVAASSEFEDAALKEAVLLYADNFDARLAQSWDAADLNALANGKKKPGNALEEKVASILVLYQEKFDDLSREFLTDNEEE